MQRAPSARVSRPHYLSIGLCVGVGVSIDERVMGLDKMKTGRMNAKVCAQASSHRSSAVAASLACLSHLDLSLDAI